MTQDSRPQPAPETTPAVAPRGLVQYEVVKDRGVGDSWRVEGIDYDRDGAVVVTIFYGADARERALEYADFKRAEINRSFHDCRALWAHGPHWWCLVNADSCKEGDYCRAWCDGLPAPAVPAERAGADEPAHANEPPLAKIIRLAGRVADFVRAQPASQDALSDANEIKTIATRMIEERVDAGTRALDLDGIRNRADAQFSHGQDWALGFADASALIAEVERLRAEVGRLTDLRIDCLAKGHEAPRAAPSGRAVEGEDDHGR